MYANSAAEQIANLMTCQPDWTASPGPHSAASTHVHSTLFPNCSRRGQILDAGGWLAGTWPQTAVLEGLALRVFAWWTALVTPAPSCSVPAPMKLNL